MKELDNNIDKLDHFLDTYEWIEELGDTLDPSHINTVGFYIKSSKDLDIIKNTRINVFEVNLALEELKLKYNELKEDILKYCKDIENETSE